MGDYYTRDRSTPQPDSFYGGEDDLSSAEGWVSDGNTHIMFRDDSIRQVYLNNLDFDRILNKFQWLSNRILDKVARRL